MKNLITPEQGASPPRKDMTGSKVGSWLVVEWAGRRYGNAIWECRCVHCDAFKKAQKGDIDARCFTCEPVMNKHPMYEIWHGIKLRCYNPNHRSYKWYGAKGIGFCKEWEDSPYGFITWVEENLGQRPPGDSTIDRIDSTRNYEPGNLQWLTRAENTSKMRSG